MVDLLGPNGERVAPPIVTADRVICQLQGIGVNIAKDPRAATNPPDAITSALLLELLAVAQRLERIERQLGLSEPPAEVGDDGGSEGGDGTATPPSETPRSGGG